MTRSNVTKQNVSQPRDSTSLARACSRSSCGEQGCRKKSDYRAILRESRIGIWMDKNNFRRAIKNRLAGHTCARVFMHALKPVLKDQGSSDAVHSVCATCTRVYGTHRYASVCTWRTLTHALARALTRVRHTSPTAEKSQENANVRAS